MRINDFRAILLGMVRSGKASNDFNEWAGCCMSNAWEDGRVSDDVVAEIEAAETEWVANRQLSKG
jgi:hypothetical protein